MDLGLGPRFRGDEQNMPQSVENDPITPKAQAQIEPCLRPLPPDRRLWAKTIEPSRRDVLQFLRFLAEHLGGAPSLRDLAARAPADVRAFLAARRADHIGSRSLMRALARLRALRRFLDPTRQGQRSW